MLEILITVGILVVLAIVVINMLNPVNLIKGTFEALNPKSLFSQHSTTAQIHCGGEGPPPPRE